MNHAKLLTIGAIAATIAVIGVAYLYDKNIVTDAIHRNTDTNTGVNRNNNEIKQTNKSPEARLPNAVKKSGNFAYITSLSKSEKIQFLDELYKSLHENEKNGTLIPAKFKDTEALSAILSLLALDTDQDISAAAMIVINGLSWRHYSEGMMQARINQQTNSQPNSGIPDISKSAEIKTALTQLITGDGTGDQLRGDAIDAYSLLYPPEPDMLNEFERLIEKGGVHEGGTLAAIFNAFTKYKRKYNYDIPASTLEATKKLVDNPSEAVKSEALTQLRISVGKPILPVLIDVLKTSRSMSLVNETVMNILLLDASDETVRQLNEIASNSSDSTKAQLIKHYTSPGNIKRLRGN